MATSTGNIGGGSSSLGLQIEQHQGLDVSRSSEDHSVRLEVLESRDAPSSSALSGRRVGIRQEAPSREPTQMQQECRDRLDAQKPGTFRKILGWAALPFVAVGVVAATAVTAVVALAATPVAWGIGKIHDLVSGYRESGDLRAARQEARDQRAHLGQPMAGGLLEAGSPRSMVTVQGHGATTVDALMETYRTSLGSSVSQADMRTYVNMGERIVTAMKDPNNRNPDGSVTVDGRVVKSNLETTRAISWYLQAKAISDNASPNRDPAFLSRGSMVMEDPGNHLYNFLNSAPNAYGRASTHFNERSSSGNAGFGNTGAAGLLAGLKSPQSAQRGIEDFDNRMPSGKGCLVFDKTTSITGGEPRLFMKWESVGVPTVFGGGTHADAESGWSDKAWNRGAAVFRCLGHSVNFVSSIVGHADGPNRREAVDKGPLKEKYDNFKAVVKQAAVDMDLGDDWAQARIKDAGKFGVAYMLDTLSNLNEHYSYWQNQRELPREQRFEWASHNGDVNGLIRDLNRFDNAMGHDPERRGAEVHVSQ